ncbi:sarcosine oxidase subunit alpha [Streptomyces sp. 2333.5]|uniref:2Fe-2S iron-sulfur cluster-binding protein n=1 Tax=unclassified Streptomyces TaxID=2593676 RepID=UPI000895AE35|nr:MULTISPECIES: 2Fe-2S iron-sulfur cluster-binding protein [unclassified Streptomyces]PJJ05580.1 sarcosine oxidase subunit alpha [Streptomyces sp. 2333.5]SEE79556.1 sarcosine oxidase subunit alpha [Streptomyces sp. 2314.4]SEF01179.1 sarcosine oxidase subunit alpha [Streptomyces sp. 2112.2]
MSNPFRAAGYGHIDRGTTLSFTFDGSAYTGHPGDTLASALLANGVHHVAAGSKYGRPRGIVAAGTEEPNALVQIEAPFPEPMLTATTVELYDGLLARGLGGQGRLSDQPDPARYDTMHAHCDVLVVGAGPAGLSAALTAARSGARVVVVDELPQPGGSLLGTQEVLDGVPASEWATDVEEELSAGPDVRVLRRTTAIGYYDDGLVLALEKRTDHLGAAAPAHVSRQRIWRIRAKQVVFATGAYERPVAFDDNDRPGIMLAGSARTYLHRFGVVAGRRIVVFTTNDSAYRAAVELADAGALIAAVIDARESVPTHWLAACAERGIDVRAGHVVTGTSGIERISRAHVALFSQGRLGERQGIDCDLLLVSGGWNPAVALFSQARGELRYDAGLGAFVPAAALSAVRTAGAASGIFTLAGCLADGADAASQALSALGRTASATTLPATLRTPPAAPGQVLWRVPSPQDGPDGSHQFVDLQRDALVADVLRATGAGLRSVEHVKRYTTIGTAHDQGRTSGVMTSGIVAQALGVDVAELGTTRFRPPAVPVAFAAFAGRNRGELFDPVRVTALHPWHVERGALFEDVGQWKRPWYYPQEGESMEEAVLRECRAARESVAMMDGSTLGKINVQGPDAGILLDRLYTNMMSTLKAGRIRYGVMCGIDGMAIDDGTVIRVAEQEFLLTTTTGNAAKVLEWMEEWLQTEWPDLRVHLTSVTEHWVTIPLVGPRSRHVLALLAPGLDVSNDAFPFMSWRDTTVAGVAARVCRISFSGELAYEINIPAWDGISVWKALYAAGSSFGITPYGTETMHVLRAEKAYPIIGQDTDGTVTPQDLGMSWVVSKKKAEFIGKRSFARPENQRTDRKQLVGLLPADERVLLPEGAQIIATSTIPAPPVPMLGHVTSSYRSDALRRTFALALVRSGTRRIGETLYVPLDGETVPVTVTDPVLFDKEGARRDG